MIRSDVVPRHLLVLLAIYCTASLVHFAHNAEFLRAYPNLPAWLTRPGVYLSWLAVTAVGVAGLVLLRRGCHKPGYLVIAGYAALGFAGLDHYAVAPMSAHTLAMNATIWVEVTAAAALLIGSGPPLIRALARQQAAGA